MKDQLSFRKICFWPSFWHVGRFQILQNPWSSRQQMATSFLSITFTAVRDLVFYLRNLIHTLNTSYKFILNFKHRTFEINEPHQVFGSANRSCTCQDWSHAVDKPEIVTKLSVVVIFLLKKQKKQKHLAKVMRTDSFFIWQLFKSDIIKGDERWVVESWDGSWLPPGFWDTSQQTVQGRGTLM